MKTLKTIISELFIFGLKQASAAMFGGFLLALIIITHFWYPIDFIHRYDFIFISAILFQIFLLAFKLESIRESIVIIVFHIVATVMELFKTSDAIGSWQYPEEYFFGIGNVPLFTGFMYSAVGSYITRVWRIFEFQYANYPEKWMTVILALAIYLNFFTHHYIWDFRWLLFAATIVLFYRTNIHFRIIKTYRYMPLLLACSLAAFFIWISENIGTYTGTWLYPNQIHTWKIVSLSKLSSWYLLLFLSFVLVTLINPIESVKKI